MERVVTTLEALQQAAGEFARTLIPHPDHATLVTLEGELGAGKTSFTQGIAKALGVKDAVTSPTFVLEKVYPLGNESPFDRLVHIDAYRLEGNTSLMPLGFTDRYKDPRNLIVLEWPSQVAEQLPSADHSIQFSLRPDTTRCITYA